MALPNFDELQRLKLGQAQKAMALYPTGLNTMMGQRSPLEHIIELCRTAQQDL